MVLTSNILTNKSWSPTKISIHKIRSGTPCAYSINGNEDAVRYTITLSMFKYQCIGYSEIGARGGDAAEFQREFNSQWTCTVTPI